ncbi:MAG: hypothetical protein Q8K98_11185 [Bacteroidota bacterium]|nr:hypothetical protein [Bacteroidota bacterium]
MHSGKNITFQYYAFVLLLLFYFVSAHSQIDEIKFDRLSVGWNLVGSIGVPVAVSSISSNPPGLVTSQFFGYEGSYFITDSLMPMKGYWVKVNQAGKLILSSYGSMSSANRINIIHDGEMPPSPPEIISTAIKTLVNDAQVNGIYQAVWIGDNNSGKKVSSGIYFYQLRAGDFVETKKMLLIK